MPKEQTTIPSHKKLRHVKRECSSLLLHSLFTCRSLVGVVTLKRPDYCVPLYHLAD